MRVTGVSKIAPPPMNVPKLRGGGKKTGFGSSSSNSERAPGYRESRKPVDSDDDPSSDGGRRAPTRPDSKSPELVQVGPGYQGNYQAPGSDASNSDLEPATGVPGAPVAGAQAGAESGINTALSPSGLESDADEEEHQSEQDQEATTSIRTEEFANTDASGDEVPHGGAEEEVSSSDSAEDIAYAEVKQEKHVRGICRRHPPWRSRRSYGRNRRPEGRLKILCPSTIMLPCLSLTQVCRRPRTRIRPPKCPGPSL